MAQYGVEATSLSGPNLAGTGAQSPVQEQYVSTNGALQNVVGMGAEVFAGYAKNLAKQDAANQENTVVGGYVKSENAIADAVKTGQITAAEGSSRSKANFSSYAASNPAYIKELKSAGDALKGFGAPGEVQQQVDDAREQRKAIVQKAIGAGWIIPTDASATTQDAILNAYQSTVRADEQIKKMVQMNQESRAQAGEIRAMNAEQRAQYTHDENIRQADVKNQSLAIVNEIAGTSMTAFQSLGTQLVSDVEKGIKSPEQAQILLAQQFTHINGGLQAGAGLNPDMANGYKSLFNELNTVFKAQLDPKTRSENAVSRVNELVAKAKMMVLNEPGALPLIATNQLLGNSPEVSLASKGPIAGLIAKITTTPAGTANFSTPQVVGNKAVEGDVFKTLKGGIDRWNDPKIQNQPQLKEEIANGINVTLKQTSDMIDKGLSPQDLSTAASFYSSSQYGQFATSGKMDKQAAQGAKKVLQISYEPAIVEGVTQKLNSYLTASAVPFDPLGLSKTAPRKELVDNLSIEFTGSGVQFVPKNVEGLSPSERYAQKEQIATLNSSAKAVTQLLHINAHMEGSTDYKAVWEARKSVYFPELFSPYGDKLPIGTIKEYDGKKYRYKGGENVAKNWKVIE